MPQPQMLVVISDDEGDLGGRTVGHSVVTPDRHQNLAIFNDERHALNVVNLGEMCDLVR
ncbi:MAG: hypothetical protein ABSA07_05405 [Acidimicrobiales bacterium]